MGKWIGMVYFLFSLLFLFLFTFFGVVRRAMKMIPSTSDRQLSQHTVLKLKKDKCVCVWWGGVGIQM